MDKVRKYMRGRGSGFSSVEMILGTAIFVYFALILYGGYNRILQAVEYERYKSTALQTATEQFELARNLTYGDVGIEGGLPAGKLKATQVLVRNGITLIASTTVRSIDDPFDGQLGSTTNDLSPADYKLLEVMITCVSCKVSQPVSFTTTVAPKGLETSGDNGALFVEVFDASGLSVQGANVHIVNATSALTIDDVTNAQGMLQIVDAPPGINAYDISVTKLGHTLDRTYEIGTTTNPNPLKPHATVATQTITAISFAIDRVSTLGVTSQSSICTPVGNYDFTLTGAKLIGSLPDVAKFPTASYSTDGTGFIQLDGLEWDTYTLLPDDASHIFFGTIPLSPFPMNPGATQNIFLILEPDTPESLMITVKDNGTGNPVTGASTTITMGAFTQEKTTGRGTQTQTDWGGGSGQETYVDPTRYQSQDASVETNSPAGELELVELLGDYVPSGVLTSSTFDTGAGSNFFQFSWLPGSQAASTTAEFQIATADTNDASTTWDYFGPDGTALTYYTIPDTDIAAVHDGDRYLRYRVYLNTASSSLTSRISDVSFTSASACIPPGQVLFSALVAGNYDITIDAPGYQPYSANGIPVGGGWQEFIAQLIPI